MLMNKTKKTILLVFTLGIMLVTIGLIIYLGPEAIIEKLGIENSYLFIFLFSILDGVSFLTAASFFSILVLMSAQLPILPLIIISAFGLTIGDTLYYTLGKNIKELGEESKYAQPVKKLKDWMNKFHPRWRFLFIFLYTSISPFPKDILCLTLGLTDYNFAKAMIPMLLGNGAFVGILLFTASLF